MACHRNSDARTTVGIVISRAVDDGGPRSERWLWVLFTMERWVRKGRTAWECTTGRLSCGGGLDRCVNFQKCQFT